MKQIIVCNECEISTDAGQDGLGFVDVDNMCNIMPGEYKGHLNKFAIYLKEKGKDRQLVIPEVDVNSLDIKLSQYQSATDCQIKLSAVRGINFSLIKDLSFAIVFKTNEDDDREIYNFVDIASPITLFRLIEKNNIGIIINGGSSIVTLTSNRNFEFRQSHRIYTIARISNFKPAVLDKKYVKDLIQKCIANKGVNDTYQDGLNIYKVSRPALDKYDMVTLRFANNRDCAKQKDENVWQTVHICVPQGTGEILYSYLNKIKKLK